MDKIGALEKFTALKTLILDHNSLTSTDSFPAFAKLEVLSLAYNNLKDVNQTMVAFSQLYPNLKHLNLIKNPINPMFQGQSAKYDEFRAMFKVMCPQLETLDGTSFSKDENLIKKNRE